jgi:Domain of unknown function (DUF5916)/Carbohydrate family 9 binding domain-like
VIRRSNAVIRVRALTRRLRFLRLTGLILGVVVCSHDIRVDAAAARTAQTSGQRAAGNSSSPPAAGSEASGRVVQAMSVSSAPRIDGRLDDEAWRTAVAAAEFRQRDPKEGEAASERTEIRVVFDEAALYVGVRLFDREASRIVRRLARRDSGSESDAVTLYLDPHHDHLTGALFEVSAAGVQRDAIIYDDRRTDFTWDAVWESGVTIDADGWTAEMRIPLSQLRFQANPEQVWGINASRYIPRKQERDWLELVPRRDSRLASTMGNLVGLDGIRSSPHLEVLPHTVAVANMTSQPTPGNPFDDGSRLSQRAGLDVKWGLSSKVTLDATVNPDFGQVEVDPAVINLTAFETSFEEKRPFFLEGTQTFKNFGKGGGGSLSTPVSLFYSRRIGRPPQGSASGQFVDRPRSTTILGAAKVTGKQSGGWTFGVLDAVTNQEDAELANGTTRSSVEVEPLTNYFAGRVSREGRRAGLGLLTTSVARQLEGSPLETSLPDQALVSGADGYVFLDSKRNWVLSGSGAGSWLTGSAAAIERQQRSSRRYYQRPDAPHVSLDTSATNLNGWTGEVGLRRNNGAVTMSSSAWAISPGFEANDLGFQRRADARGAQASVTIFKYEPDGFSHQRWISFSKAFRWNFNGDTQEDAYSVSAAVLFRNYWNLDGSYTFSRRAQDDRLTRGGPSGIAPRRQTTTLGFSTDGSRTVALSTSGYYSKDEYDAWDTGGGVYVDLKPSSFLSMSAGPYVARSHYGSQFIDIVEDQTKVETFGHRYIFADIAQTQVSITTRVNLSMSPTVSLQVYAEPFVGVGDYEGIKELVRPGTYDFSRYGVDAGEISYHPISLSYSIDPDGSGPASQFTVYDPDFNSKFLALKAVLRWEWRPGSTLYAAWTQQRYDAARPGDFDFGRDFGTLFRSPSDNVFLLKVSYWLGR